MKNYLYIIVLFLCSTSVYAQFSISTETAYLNHINAQGREDLISNNIANAELVFAQLLSNIDSIPNESASLFLYQLSKSYQQINQAELSLHRLLVLRCLYPHDSISSLMKPMFGETAYASGFEHSFVVYLWETTMENQRAKNANQNLLKLIELSIQLHQEKLHPYIIQLGNQLRLMNISVPLWYDEWEYLVRIGVKEKHLKSLINFEETQRGSLKISSIEVEKLRKKVYRKSIRYYLHENAFSHSKEILRQYKNEDKNWIESFDYFIKKMRIAIHW